MIKSKISQVLLVSNILAHYSVDNFTAVCYKKDNYLWKWKLQWQKYKEEKNEDVMGDTRRNKMWIKRLTS